MKKFYFAVASIILLGIAFAFYATTAQAQTGRSSAGSSVMTIEGGDTHDFGKIEYGKPVEHVFVFKNTGNAPLLILDAATSCGCTTPQWTKEPVAPGAKGEVKVRYNGSGYGKVKKSITLTTNTEAGRQILYITADVQQKK